MPRRSWRRWAAVTAAVAVLGSGLALAYTLENGHAPTGAGPPSSSSPASSTATGSPAASATASSAAATATVTPSAAAPGTAIPAVWQSAPAAVVQTVNNFVSEQGAEGVVVAVSTGSQRYAVATGLANVTEGTAMSTDTVSALRSITKSFVGTVVLQLVDEGKLSLAEPIVNLVPGVADTAGGAAITIEEALQMRTGLAEYSNTDEFAAQLNATNHATFTDAELLQDAFSAPLEFAPGTEFEYSNTNFVLLGAVIEAVAGQSWAQEVSSRILQPLKLTSITYPADASLVANVAIPYAKTDDGVESLDHVSPTLYSAAGGLYSNIGDLLTWGQALGSGKLLSPSLAATRASAMSTAETGDFTSAYDAYGLALGEIDGWWGHTGVGFGYESLVMYNPATGTTVAVELNTQLADPNAAAALFRALESEL